MAVLKLRDEGKLSLDDPVSRYVPARADLPYRASTSAEFARQMIEGVEEVTFLITTPPAV